MFLIFDWIVNTYDDDTLPTQIGFINLKLY